MANFLVLSSNVSSVLALDLDMMLHIPQYLLRSFCMSLLCTDVGAQLRVFGEFVLVVT